MLQQVKHLIKKYLWSIVFRNKIYDAAVVKNEAFIASLNS